MMIETHAHLDNAQFSEDIDNVVARAHSAGVQTIVVPSINPGNFDAVAGLCQRYETLVRGIGVHPHHAHEFDEAAQRRIERDATDPKVVALGEVGLDYYYDFSPIPDQKRAFRRQIQMAKDLHLPLIVHNRESDSDVLSMLEEEQDGRLRAVLHCFSSGIETLTKALDLGFFVSFTGNITHKKSSLGEVVAACPLDRVMIETDSPYMAPTPHRGKRNEPAFVGLVAQKIAELQSVSVEKVVEMTTYNASRFFRFAMLVLMLASMFSVGLTAQSERREEEDEVGDEETELLDEMPNPYVKRFGFGLQFGPNTVIELVEHGVNKENSDTRSSEGLPAFGGVLQYGLTDNLIVDFGYMFSRNNKVREQFPGTLAPTYQLANLGVRGVVNPSKPVAFFGATGLSYANLQNLDGGRKLNQAWGMYFSLGLYYTWLLPFGQIVPTAEWRLDYSFGQINYVDVPFNSRWVPNDVNITTYYSIPRVSIIYYPSWGGSTTSRSER